MNTAYTLYLFHDGQMMFVQKGAAPDRLMVTKTTISKWIRQLDMEPPAKADLEIREATSNRTIYRAQFGGTRLRWTLV